MKSLLWRRFGATGPVPAATPYETPAVASPGRLKATSRNPGARGLSATSKHTFRHRLVNEAFLYMHN